MEEHEPSGDLKLLLERFRDCGGVVEYVLISNNLEAETDTLHSAAVWFGMTVVKGRMDALRAAADPASQFAEFPGWVISAEPPRVSRPQTVTAFMQEYFEAFSHPPYPLYDRSVSRTITTDESTTLFGQVNTLIFGEFATWSVRRWNTEWSTYFDDGREWWGTYLWTVVHENHRHCVWIGASATD